MELERESQVKSRAEGVSLSNSGQTAAPVQLLHGQCHEAVRGHGTETEARGEMEGQAGGCHWPRDPVQSRWRERERERERERLVRVEGGSCGWTGTRSRRPQEAELGTHGRRSTWSGPWPGGHGGNHSDRRADGGWLST